MRIFWLVAVLFVFGSFPAAAQKPAAASAQLADSAENNAPHLDYQQIGKNLNRIDTRLASAKADTAETGEILSNLDDLYEEINRSRLYYNDRLTNVQKKIDALGAAPADGKEPKAIAAQRLEFTREADQYKTQVAQANLAQTKIDDIRSLILKLRNRALFDNIFSRQSSLFQPQEFIASLKSFGRFIIAVAQSPRSWYHKLSAADRASADQNIVYAFVAVIVAFIAAVYIRRYIRAWFGYRKAIPFPSYTQKVHAALWMFVARGLIPAAILGAFLWWIRSYQLLVSSDFGILLDVSTRWLLYFFLIWALIRTALVPDNPQWRIFEIGDSRAASLSRSLIWAAGAICVVTWLQNLSQRLGSPEDILYSLQLFANIVKAVCVIVIAYKFLYTNQSVTVEQMKNGDIPQLSASSQLSLAIVFFMILALGAAVFGYLRLSAFAINRFILSAVIIAGFYILNRLLRVLFKRLLQFKFWVNTFRISPRTLVKINLWFGILLKPLLGLIAVLVLLAVWGVSVDILISRVKSFLIGFNIGSVHISITSVLLGILAFFVSLSLFKMLKNSFTTGSLSQLDIDNGVKSSLLSMISFISYVISGLLAIAVMGGSLGSIAIIAGALSFGVGLGLQNMVSNLAAGFTILFERPIKVGDWVILNGQEGIVKQINMRATELETWNKSVVIVPNSDILSKNVINKTYANRLGRIEIKVGVDYESDINKVKQLLLDIAGRDPDVLQNPSPSLIFTDLGDNSLNFQLNLFTSNVYNSAAISTRVRQAIVEQFRQAGINIPFPQRVVHFISAGSPPETVTQT